jgi:hypothetical protein
MAGAGALLGATRQTRSDRPRRTVRCRPPSNRSNGGLQNAQEPASCGLRTRPVRSLVATIGAAYFVVTGFIQPALHDRDRLWCERWTGFALGVIAIAVGSVLISILEKKGIIVIAAHWVASCILWLLF